MPFQIDGLVDVYKKLCTWKNNCAYVPPYLISSIMYFDLSKVVMNLRSVASIHAKQAGSTTPKSCFLSQRNAGPCTHFYSSMAYIHKENVGEPRYEYTTPCYLFMRNALKNDFIGIEAVITKLQKNKPLTKIINDNCARFSSFVSLQQPQFHQCWY